MNAVTPALGPLAIGRSLLVNHGLILALAKRDILGRYRGSVLGLLWSFFHPLLMLGVYTFVFAVVIRAWWPGGSGSWTEFALILFAGLITFNVFSECANRAPGLIVGNASYVTKVVFPIEILPVVALASALFHMCASLMVWLLFHLAFFGLPGAGTLLFPVVLLPILPLTLGTSWALASLGVYLRDIAQVTGVATTILLFLSPVFYSVNVVPEKLQWLMRLSPLTIVIEQARDVLVFNRAIDWWAWAINLSVSLAVAWLGFAWFQKTRKGFADVL
jgi:lipopolysaccharide transport system permease protein